MPEETNAAAQQPEEPPADFNDYVAYRQALAEGKPAPEPKNPTAPAEGTQQEAKTAPDSGTGKPKDQEEDDDEEEDDGEGATAADSNAKPTEPTKRKGGFQRRIDQLTREKRALEARVAALETRPAQDAGKPVSEKPSATPVPDKEPVVDDFETYEQFTKAQVRYEHAQIRKEETAEQQQKAAKEAQRAEAQAESDRMSAFASRREEVRKEHPDYDEVVETAGDLYIPAHMDAALMRHPDGPLLVYSLAKDREEAKRIAAIRDPLDAAVAIGAYAQRIAKTSEPAPKSKAPITGAPKPVTPLKNGRST